MTPNTTFKSACSAIAILTCGSFTGACRDSQAELRQDQLERRQTLEQERSEQERASAKVAEASEALAEDVRQAKEEFVERVDELDEHMTKLRAKAGAASADTKDAVGRILVEVENGVSDAKRDITSIGADAADDLQAAQKRIEQKLARLEDRLDSADAKL